jgi:hypothetical protein
MAKKPKPIGAVIQAILKEVDRDGKLPFFMPSEFQVEMAMRINAVVDLPIFNEKQERAILIKIVQALDRNTFKFIPREVLEVAFTDQQALPGEMIDALKDSLPLILATAVPLPFLPPGVKAAIIAAFLAPLLRALRDKISLGDLLRKND